MHKPKPVLSDSNKESNQQAPAPLTRRDFLIYSGSLTAGAYLPGCSTEIRPDDGVRPVNIVKLDVQWTNSEIAGTPVRLRTYGGSLPGPLIETRPGHTIKVQLNNRLDAYDSSAWEGNHNVPHHLNTTNLHLHGLEIVPHLFQPVGTSDPAAAMIAVGPGERYDYSFDVPDDQPSGLFWYHPHHHGSTAVQAVNGMAGALIVRGPIDEVPEIKAAQEFVIAVQDIGLFPPGEGEGSRWMYNPPQNAIWQTFDGYVTRLGPDGKPVKQPDLSSGFTTGDYPLRYFLANGQPYYKETHNPSKPLQPIGTQLAPPRYTLRPGEVAWFRILNGTSDDLMPLVVEGHAMYLTALDGVNLLEPRKIPPPQGKAPQAQLSLASANRGEFLIRASSKPGTYRIRQLEQDQQFLLSEARILAELVVEGEPVQMGLPDKLPVPTRHYPLIREDEIVARHEVVFTGMFPAKSNVVVGIDFLINGEAYGEQRIDRTVRRGTAEEWTLRVPHDEQHGGTEGHPFHIHVNSFEVVEIDGVRQDPILIMDTIWVPKGSTIKIRSRFREWIGKSVYHCHILPHEDTGMMQNVLIAAD